MRETDTDAQDSLTIAVADIRPHPDFHRHCPVPPTEKVNAIIEMGERGFDNPILLTQNNIILDGFARWHVARLKGRCSLLCVRAFMADDDALRCVIQRHRRSNGINDFSRIRMALELEGSFKSAARLNQQLGGKFKGSSILAGASGIDVRAEIAKLAGVSTGTVTKVKRLIEVAKPELLNAVRSKEVSIHRCWVWLQTPSDQLECLRKHRIQHGVRRTISNLIRAHKRSGDMPDLTRFLAALSKTDLKDLECLELATIDFNEPLMFVSKGLLRTVGIQGELRYGDD